MKPGRWRCACFTSDGLGVERSAFTVACPSCGVIAPWFLVSRAPEREDVSATNGMEA